MKSKFIKTLLPIFFWCLVWEGAALIIGSNFLLPDIIATIKALLVLLTGAGFYKAILFSLIRVVLGLALGVLAGFVLAVLSNKFEIFNTLISPIISVIKSTPVATFILLLWVLLSGDMLSIFIGFLMVVPIIWQNLLDGYKAIDKELSELCDVYQFSYKKRVKLLILPTLKRFFAPALITSLGLCWKAEIAAEIIAYTKNSIGQGINDAKYLMDTPTVFAWTVVIVVFSLCLEKGTKFLLGRTKK